jgi:hypothetical protein
MRSTVIAGVLLVLGGFHAAATADDVHWRSVVVRALSRDRLRKGAAQSHRRTARLLEHRS